MWSMLCACEAYEECEECEVFDAWLPYEVCKVSYYTIL